MFSRLKNKLDNRVRKFVRKHTSFKNTFAGLEIGNVLVSISTTLLMALGSLPLSLPVLIALAIFLIVIGIIGRYIDEVSDDNERLKLYEKHLNEIRRGTNAYQNSSFSDTDIVRNECVQLSEGGDKKRTNRNVSCRE